MNKLILTLTLLMAASQVQAATQVASFNVGLRVIATPTTKSVTTISPTTKTQTTISKGVKTIAY